GVVGGARRVRRIVEEPLVEALDDLVRRRGRLRKDALERRPSSSVPARGREELVSTADARTVRRCREVVLLVRRRLAALSDLILEIGDVGVTVDDRALARGADVQLDRILVLLTRECALQSHFHLEAATSRLDTRRVARDHGASNCGARGA